MPVTASFRMFALDQLGRATPGGVRAKSMFGGVGIYAGERFFALLDDDTLYLKVDDATRTEFVAAGMRPFAPSGDVAHVMSYYGVPGDVLEDGDALQPWVAKALAAADRKSQLKRRKPFPPG